MRVIAVGGMPGAGKSALVQSVLNEMMVRNSGERFGLGPLKGYWMPEAPLLVLGLYGSSKHPGTDKLSMAVQPLTVDFLRWARTQSQFERAAILFEGDRLCTLSFFYAVREMKIDLKLILLEADAEELDRRYKERGTAQSETFLQGRATKYRKLKEELDCVEVWKNQTRKDLNANIERLLWMVVGAGAAA
jgi:hypothetical protein